MQVLAADPLSLKLKDAFERLGLKVVMNPKALATSDLLFIRSSTRVDSSLIERAPRLRAVIRAGVGLDHIDRVACAQRNIRVIYSPAASSQSVAELTLMLMFEALRFTRQHREALSRGHFRAPTTRGFELKGKAVGLIGLGRIGTKVAQLLKAFGAKVSATDPYRSASYFQRRGVERHSLTSLLENHEIISIHCPLTAETRGLIGAAAFKKMRKGVFLINTARGAIVNESDLLTALRSTRVASYAVDVLEKEPPAPDHPLLAHERVFWLPHLGAQTEEAQSRQDDDLIQQVSYFLKARNLNRV